ncbi:MAG TPA: class I SAM-dependent methyltransferase [Patescibacteria group bacterium]|nr:class I SAM-dependent methyltransferase [Patescibacteria group bacterium]
MIEILQKIIAIFMDYIVGESFVQKKLKNKNVKKIIDLYAKTDYTKSFVKFRFWFGPLYEVNNLTPKFGTILDIGSGEGILANFLALNNVKRKVVGVEINKDRIKEANKGLKNTKFIAKSAFSATLPKADAIVVSHVMHHLGSMKLQEKLLDVVYKKLKKNGKFILAEVDREFSLRYLFGFFADTVPIPIFFEKKLFDFKIYHRSKKDWTKLLKKHGFKIVYQKNTEDRAYPEVIFVAIKND